jgi:Ca-activated chloride channel family protein
MLLTLALLWAAARVAVAQEEGPVGPGALVLGSAGGSQLAPRVHSTITVRVEGIAARVLVSQAFVNGTSEWVDGVYVFPLPDAAAVDQLEMTVAGRRIVGQIAERHAARAAYQQARQAGHKATLVEQERPNLFTSSVANIGPGESVQVQIGYWLQPRYEQGSFTLTVPLTLTPRYIPGLPLSGLSQGTGWAADTHPVGDASRITPPLSLDPTTAPHFQITVDINAGFALQAIESATHPILSENLGERYRVSLASGTPLPMDRDFELVWRLRSSATAEVAVFTETHHGAKHALLLAVPPVGDAPARATVPRELILVVDTSGSMHGLAMAEARRALDLALGDLGPDDRFNLIRFADVARRLFPASVPAAPENITRARTYLSSLRAEGGTELAAALLSALQQPADPGRLRQVVFITDGSVGNEEQLFAIIQRHLVSGRLFTVGLGAAPNGWFMRKAATFGRGTYTRIPTMDQVVPRMGGLLERLRAPAVTELAVDWPVDGAQAYPPRLPDLYGDQPLTVLARLDAKAGLVTLAGRSGDGYWLRQQPLPAQDSPGIAQLWARARVEALLDRRVTEGELAVRDDVLATGLSYGLLTPYTALVAIEDRPSRPKHLPSVQHAVASALPHGTTAGAIFGFPATGAGLWLQMLLGVLALSVSGALFWGATWGVSRA